MKIKKQIIGWVSGFALAALLLSACGAAAPAEPTMDPNMIFTQVAETVMVSMTQTAVSMPPTPTPEPTATIAPTIPPLPTEPPLPLTTPLPIGPTPTIQRFGDAAKFGTNSPKDGSTFGMGDQFTITVCFDNIGTSEWTNEYYLEWVDGPRLWSNTRYFYVETLTKPGKRWCFTLPSVAPYKTGPQITRWYFKNPDGQKMEEFYFPYTVQ